MRRTVALAAVLSAPILWGAAASAAEVVLVPHRAAYELSLAGATGNRPIESADGRIALEFTEATCEGYAFNFRQATRINTGEGETRTSELRSTTFEDVKGELFRFNSQSFTNNRLERTTEGRAERGSDGGVSVALTRPKRAKLDFDGVAAFPTHHMRQLIEAAQAGKTVFEMKIYDGSDGGEKVYDTTALIGAKPVTGEAGLEEASAKAGLGDVRRWPVRISYFEPGAGERTPVYVLSFDMFENGISGALRLDFGEFRLKGEMKRLDLLPKGDCPR